MTNQFSKGVTRKMQMISLHGTQSLKIFETNIAVSWSAFDDYRLRYGRVRVNISMFHLALVHYHRLQLDKSKKNRKKQFTLSLSFHVRLWMSNNEVYEPQWLQTSRSFDYDNHCEQACACSSTTNNISLFISENQKPFFVGQLVKKKEMSTIDRFSFAFIHIEYLSIPISWHVVSSWLLYISHY